MTVSHFGLIALTPMHVLRVSPNWMLLFQLLLCLVFLFLRCCLIYPRVTLISLCIWRLLWTPDPPACASWVLGYTYAAPHLDGTMLVEPGALCIRGKHTTNWATSLAPFLYLSHVLLGMNITKWQISSQGYWRRCQWLQSSWHQLADNSWHSSVHPFHKGWVNLA